MTNVTEYPEKPKDMSNECIKAMELKIKQKKIFSHMLTHNQLKCKMEINVSFV